MTFEAKPTKKAKSSKNDDFDTILNELCDESFENQEVVLKTTDSVKELKERVLYKIEK